MKLYATKATIRRAKSVRTKLKRNRKANSVDVKMSGRLAIHFLTKTNFKLFYSSSIGIQQFILNTISVLVWLNAPENVLFEKTMLSLFNKVYCTKKIAFWKF